MREQVIHVIEQYLDAVRNNRPADLQLHPDVVAEFPTYECRGAKAYRKRLVEFSKIVRDIEILHVIVDGEQGVAIVNIDTTFGRIPFAEHIQVKDGQIVYIRGYADPRPIIEGAEPTP